MGFVEPQLPFSTATLFVLHLQMIIPSLAEHLNKHESENETKTRKATQK